MTMEAIRDAKTLWTERCNAWKELSKSLNKAVKDLSNNISKRKEAANIKKESSEQTRRESEANEAKIATKKKADYTASLHQKCENCTFFTLPLSRTQAALHCLESEEEIATARAQPDGARSLFEKPFVVTSSKAVSKYIKNNPDVQEIGNSSARSTNTRLLTMTSPMAK